MKNVKNGCSICQNDLAIKFSKYSDPLRKNFDIYKCSFCGNWQIFPLPDEIDLTHLYENTYFAKRTNRGYDNYTSDAVKQSIISTLEKNLEALNFYKWEENLDIKNSLEIGAAAGYFVEYLQNRGWNSMGIDISKTMTDAAIRKGLNILHGNFLKYDFKNRKFNLIAMWATLEHLMSPDKFIKKISEILLPGGHLYITTTNTGFWAKVYGINWRYLNVPEHIYYFNRRSLATLFENHHMKIVRSFTYGSGFTTRENSSMFYKFFKKVFDQSAKWFHNGDMIVLDVMLDVNSRF